LLLLLLWIDVVACGKLSQKKIMGKKKVFSASDVGVGPACPALVGWSH
jgi:hypothetical protein